MIRSYDSVEEAVRNEFGEGVVITDRSYIGGGDINDAACLTFNDGRRIFMKSNRISNKRFFDTEVTGLEAIAATGTIQVPELICKGTDRGKGISFLMMELVRGERRIKDFWEVFGRELAAMHLADTDSYVRGGRYGFTEDNYIGAGEQINERRSSFVEFFRDCRLRPQFDRAGRYFDRGLVKSINRLLDNLQELLIEPEKPSLLHGDLWSGNYIVGNDGRAWLIDPAVYVGCAEADIAMTELFGGYASSFYGAYHEIIPVTEGYERRRNVYNLYHMLNHLNLFGRGYLSSVVSIISQL